MNKNISLAIKGTAGALAAAFALSFPLVANAEGFYADIGLGQATFDIRNTPGVSVDDTDTTYSVGAGYKFNDNIAIEGGYLKLGSISARGAISASVETDGYYLGPVLSTQFADKFEAYVRAGVYFWNVDSKVTSPVTGTTNSDGNDLYYGIGAAYKATKNVSVGADWTRYNIDLSGSVLGDVDVLSARLKYSF